MKKHYIILFLTMLPLVVSAENVEIDGIYYNLVSKTKEAEVIRNPDKYSGSIIIPEFVIYKGEQYIVNKMGEEVFRDCDDLTEVTIGNLDSNSTGTIAISGSCFSGCGNLKIVRIGNNVSEIGINSFYNCGKLTNLYIGKNVKKMDYGAFEGCRNIETVHITDLAAWCNMEFYPITFVGIDVSNPLCYARHLFLNGKDMKNLEIPNNVTTINPYTFYLFKGITSVSIPNSVTSVGFCAFSQCAELTSIYLPNSLVSIEDGAFDRCPSLTSITIPSSVKKVGYGFSGCNALTSVYITSMKSWVEIENGVSISSPFHLYLNGEEVSDLVIPNGVATIGHLFSNCISIKTVVIPNSVKTIGYESFRDCVNLKTVTLGNGVEEILYGAFINCPELSDLYCFAEIPPKMNNDVFRDSYVEYATLHVPSSSINDYKNRYGWKEFKNIVDIEGTIPPEPEQEEKVCEKPIILYNNGKLIFNCATEGAVCKSTITDTDIKSYSGNEVTLTATYQISVYATKDGYTDSEPVTATLCWVEQQPTTEGIINDVANVSTRALLIQSHNGCIIVQGAEDGESMKIYDISGFEICSTVVKQGIANLYTNLKPGSVAIVEIGKKTVKVVIK